MAHHEGMLEGMKAGQAMGAGVCPNCHHPHGADVLCAPFKAADPNQPVLQVTFTLVRDDSIPAFGGFLRCAPECECKDNVVLVNVQGVMSPVLECEDGEMVHQTKEERKRLLITTLMHEFGHVLEKHFGLPDVEEAVEKACDEWEAQWRKALDAEGQKMPETYEQQLERLLVESFSYSTAVDVWRLGHRQNTAPSSDHMPTFDDLPPHIQERVREYRDKTYGIR